MKVKITSYGTRPHGESTSWCKDHVGEEFAVTTSGHFPEHYVVATNDANDFRLIRKREAVQIQTKTTEPEGARKFDKDKPDWSLIPLATVEDIVKVLTFGAKKYDRDNWQGVSSDRYLAAAMRHISSYQAGERTDPESGLPTIAHAQCCLLFMAWKDSNQPQPGK